MYFDSCKIDTAITCGIQTEIMMKQLFLVSNNFFDFYGPESILTIPDCYTT